MKCIITKKMCLICMRIVDSIKIIFLVGPSVDEIKRGVEPFLVFRECDCDFLFPKIIVCFIWWGGEIWMFLNLREVCFILNYMVMIDLFNSTVFPSFLYYYIISRRPTINFFTIEELLIYSSYNSCSLSILCDLCSLF